MSYHQPSEFVVVRAAVPRFPEMIDTTICICPFDLVDLPLILKYHFVVLVGLSFVLTPLTGFCPSFVFVSITVATPSGSLQLEHRHLMHSSGLVHTRCLPWPCRRISQPRDLNSNHIHQLQPRSPRWSQVSQILLFALTQARGIVRSQLFSLHTTKVNQNTFEEICISLNPPRVRWVGIKP